MGLKCSVLGHRYGESAVEREREEQGSEVVITIRELETCQRCGNTRVVSENKEVTAVETPDDDLADAATGTDQSDEPADDTSPPGEPADEGAEIVDADDTDDADDAADAAEDAVDVADDTTAGGVDESPAPDLDGDDVATDPETDDAVILDADDDTEDTEDTDAETDDRAAAETTEGRTAGQWPEEPADDEDDWTPGTSPDDEPSVEPTSSAVTVPEGTFQCTECSFTTDVESSSLREGDFCPECHRGTLVHDG